LTIFRLQKARIVGAGIGVAIAAASVVQLTAGTGGSLTTSKTQTQFSTAAKVTSNKSATDVATSHNPVKTLKGYAPACPGPSGNGHAPVTVSVHRNGRLVRRDTLHKPYTFAYRLAPGVYHVSNGVLKRRVTIKANLVTHVRLPATCG
jgi:hypothetical protein